MILLNDAKLRSMNLRQLEELETEVAQMITHSALRKPTPLTMRYLADYSERIKQAMREYPENR